MKYDSGQGGGVGERGPSGTRMESDTKVFRLQFRLQIHYHKLTPRTGVFRPHSVSLVSFRPPFRLPSSRTVQPVEATTSQQVRVFW